MPTEITPVLIRNEDEAGSIWRSEKLKDFEWRIRCLGLENDPMAIQLLNTIAATTSEIETIAEKQRDSDYERKWWQDGEYDADKADCENDKGILHLRNKQYSDAFAAFTEAIRLCPSSAVYHCNRAAAALKLSQPQIAANDAESAIERDKDYLKAHLRAGRAYIMLKQPDKAIDHYQHALHLQPGNTTALQGIQESKELQLLQQKQEERNRLQADDGQRDALPRSAISEHTAAQLLYSAEQMLLVNPNLESAKCTKVEALIACKRYQDALMYSSENLLEGVEKCYLEAEAWWRDGNVSNALISIQQVAEYYLNNTNTSTSSTTTIKKCIDLESYLHELNEKLNAINDAISDDIYFDAIEHSNQLLSSLDPGACCGLYCNVLCKKAQAQHARRMFDEAQEQLNTALSLQSDHIDALLLRASVYKEQGMYVEYFLDVSSLRRIAPGHEQLPYLIQDAARCCSFGGNGSGSGGNTNSCNRKSRHAVVAMSDGSSRSALQVLGIKSLDATDAEIRRAYLQYASQWHPDKWSSASEEERKNAEERFKEIKAAYEAVIA